MALQFTPSSEKQTNTQVVQTTATVESAPLDLQIKEAQNFNIVVKKEELKQQLVSNDEVNKLVGTININDANSIVTFGSQVAEEISKASDQILKSMSIQQINDTGTLLNNLSILMDRFDIKEFKDEKKGFFENLKKKIEKMLEKYETMGGEIDKIYVQLKGYEKEIGESNVKLETLYVANIGYYQDLLKYIMAGEQAVKELDDYIIQYRQKVESSPNDGTIRMDLNNLEQMRDIMDQRVMDLKIAENVAIQTVPMLKTMEYSNLNLIRKINSAFIITMPVFKQALAQAIMLKRQRIQAESLKALDDKTNELLIRNAQNTVEQAKMTTALAAGSSIKVETLEKTWQTIVTGIEETKKIQDEARKKRAEDSTRLEMLKTDFKSKMHI